MKQILIILALFSLLLVAGVIGGNKATPDNTNYDIVNNL